MMLFIDINGEMSPAETVPGIEGGGMEENR
jgi:hypothetical protein